MEQSRCCGAPIVVEIRPDLPNFTDDDYELRVPFQVCSKCGATIIEDKYQYEDQYQGGKARHAAAKGTVL